MKKILFIFLFTIISNKVFSQNEKHNVIFKDFKQNFNQGNFENIFNGFSDEMKNALPIEKTKEFLGGLKLQAGNIEDGAFVKFENQSFAVYKTEFEKSILAVNISIDAKNLINGFYVKPFVDEVTLNRVNALSEFPSEIANSIYSQAKNLPNKTQLSIAILTGGDVRYYGVLIENDTINSIKNFNRIFEIGSITKVFTSTVLASLAIDKKLDLNNYVNDYYSIDFKNSVKINFSDLANHTSGLPRLPENFDLSNEINPYGNYGERELYEYLRHILEIKNSPEKKYDYSNLGAGLLGYTLGISQKTNFNDLLQKRVFNKYKMKNSYTGPKGIESNIVKGLDTKGQEIPNWEFDVLFGGGGILSSTEDLVKFSRAQFDKSNKELELTRKATFNINDRMKIGLGWHILKTDKGSDWIWHNGGTGGYSSSMVLDVEKKNGVIVLSNVSAFNPQMANIEKLCFGLMKLVKN